MEQTNPLLNDVVLDTLFQMLPLTDLLKSRLVCRQWNSNTLVFQRMYEEVKLSFGKDMPNFHPHLKRLSKFLDDVECIEKIPFSTFSLSSLPMADPIVEKFFDNCGPSIRHLRLMMGIQNMDISQLRHLLLFQVPFLTTLEIAALSSRAVLTKKLFPSNSEGPGPNMPYLKRFILQETRKKSIAEFLADIFAAAPNIEEMILAADVCKDWENQRGVFSSHSPAAASAFTALKSTGNVRNLKRLICGILDASNFKCLIQLSESGLRLHILDMKRVANDVTTEIVETFLATQTDLEEFTISHEVYTRKRGELQRKPFRLQLPRKMKLTTLKLAHRQKELSVLVFPINFSRQLSNLRVLIIHGWAPSMNMNEYFSLWHNASPCLSLKELVLPGEIEDTFPSTLATIFPNVTKLEIVSPSNKFLTSLWINLPNLEILKITAASDLNIDSGFTGIESNVCNRILKENRFEYYSEVSTEIRSKASICDLKNLKRLYLIIQLETVSKGKGTSTLTDVSGYLAFIHMHHLQYLSITSIHWFKGILNKDYSGLSKTCRFKLAATMAHTVVHVSPLVTYDINHPDVNSDSSSETDD